MVAAMPPMHPRALLWRRPCDGPPLAVFMAALTMSGEAFSEQELASLTRLGRQGRRQDRRPRRRGGILAVMPAANLQETNSWTASQQIVERALAKRQRRPACALLPIPHGNSGSGSKSSPHATRPRVSSAPTCRKAPSWKY